MIKNGVSIVITCYNDPRVFRCINSVNACEDDSFKKEIIVVLVSNKEIELELKKIGGVRICFAPKGNLSLSLNTGIKNSKFDKIIILDSDTTVSRNFLQELITLAGKYDIVKSDIVFEHKSWLTGVIARSRKMGHVGNAYNPGILIKKKVFEKIGYFNEKVRFSEDGEFNTRVKKSKISFFQTKRAKIFHPPISLGHDLRMAYKIGRGKRCGVEYGEMTPDEDFCILLKRIAVGSQIRYYIKEAREWGIDVATYDILWFVFYYLGYYVEKYKKFSKKHG